MKVVLQLIACLIFVVAIESYEFKATRFRQLGRSFSPKYHVKEPKNDACAQFRTIAQKIDHFNFDKNTDLFYQQRYIYSDMYWRNSSGNPIFFYTGNEGDIQWFCENTGFVWEIASKFSALVVFAEHRYYGQSLPFGNKSFDSPYINFLTSEQALADYAYLIDNLKASQPILAKSPVIAFGGSYGGMLAAWFRIKYQNMVAGSLAASAPVWQFTADCDTFLRITTDAFRKADNMCPVLINASWAAINALNSTQGLDQLTKTFKLCKPLKSVDDLKDWLADAYGNIAMANYPYPANFLSDLPAWPVRAMCLNITNSYFYSNQIDESSLLTAIYRGINVFANYTGNVKCFELGDATPFDINMISWTYQTCTEFVFSSCSNGKTDMFEPEQWNYDDYKQACKDQFQVTPRAEWPSITYGAKAIDWRDQSNIIFSNGALDPWSGGGVLDDINKRTPALLIKDGAHHLDLRSSNPLDPESVIKARLIEIDAIQKWIEEYTNSI